MTERGLDQNRLHLDRWWARNLPEQAESLPQRKGEPASTSGQGPERRDKKSRGERLPIGGGTTPSAQPNASPEVGPSTSPQPTQTASQPEGTPPQPERTSPQPSQQAGTPEGPPSLDPPSAGEPAQAPPTAVPSQGHFLSEVFQFVTGGLWREMRERLEALLGIGKDRLLEAELSEEPEVPSLSLPTHQGAESEARELLRVPRGRKRRPRQPSLQLTVRRNRHRAFPPLPSPDDPKAYVALHTLQNRLAQLVDLLAEDLVGPRLPGEAYYDPEALLLRKIDRRPLHRCRYDRARETLLFLIDTSSSCESYSTFFQRVAYGVLRLRSAELWEAPNGEIVGFWRWDPHNQEPIFHEQAHKAWPWRGRVIVFLGDYDGADQLIVASRHNQVWWLCNEERHKDLAEHPFYSDRSLQEFRGKILPVREEADFLQAMRKIHPL